MTEEKFLYTYSIDSISLSQSLQNSKNYLIDAIAVLYSPEECIFARFDNNELKRFNHKSHKEEVICTDKFIFEARIFNENCELRWLNKSNGKGRAVILLDSQAESISPVWNINSPTEYITQLPQKYLLWGEKTLDKNNNFNLDHWKTLSSARIGTFSIPLKQELSINQRVYLKTCEYFQKIDDHGNVSVIEERLSELTTI